MKFSATYTGRFEIGRLEPKESGKGKKALGKIKAGTGKNSKNDVRLQTIIDGLSELLNGNKVTEPLHQTGSLEIENS